MNIMNWFAGLPRSYHLILSILVTAVIGVVDSMTGYELRMELFYLLPISYATWFLGQRIGILFSMISIITIVFSDIKAGKTYSSFNVEFWNGAMYFVFYVIVTLLLKLRVSLQQRENLIEELDNALRQNEELMDLLPVCPSCKKLRVDEAYRQKVESYVLSRRAAGVQTGLCAECSAKFHSAAVQKKQTAAPSC
jgi:hypothetical protein